MSTEKGFLEKITNSQIWKSVFRHGFPDTPRTRALTILSNVFLHLHPARVVKNALRLRHTWCMGGIAFFLFIVETITGVLLMFYYHPNVRDAYNDMKYLEFDVPFGMLLRNLHRWGAHLMVIVVWLHMLRVFMTRSYKSPREFNWVVGVMLLTLTLLLSFTGYLLPWDQLSIWAVTVGTNMAGATPLIGHEGPFGELLGRNPFNDIRALLLGGPKVGGNTLLRFYVMHCLALPLVITVFMAVHFWRVRKDGGVASPL